MSSPSRVELAADRHDGGFAFGLGGGLATQATSRLRSPHQRSRPAAPRHQRNVEGHGGNDQRADDGDLDELLVGDR
jgi:hypothetical protein